jgi:RNA polymerase sigma factor (sigma-70 family)
MAVECRRRAVAPPPLEHFLKFHVFPRCVMSQYSMANDSEVKPTIGRLPRDRCLAATDNASLVASALLGGPGGRRAWDELVRCNSRAVWKVLWALGLTKDERDDAYQGTWLRAVESLHQVREPQKVHVWLMMIARHEAEAVLRRKSRLVPVGDIADSWELSVDSDRVEREERYGIARAALARMTEECRALVRMLTNEDLSYRDIEEVMGWSSGGTAVRRSRCLEKIRDTPEVTRYLTELGRTVNKERGV